MNTRNRQTRNFQPVVDSLGQRCLLSVAVAEVLNKSTSNITAEFRWTPSSNWTTFTEKPGQGELFWSTYSTSLTPQVRYTATTSSSSQIINVLARGYGQWSGTGTPPTSAATLYQFQNTSTGVQLYFAATPKSTLVDHPAAATSYTVVSAPLFGPSGPSFLDVRQGASGDCWLLSSLAEVTARDPSDIRNMFTYDGTTVENGVTVGIYTVRLFNGSGVPEYVNVDTELPSGGNYYDHPNGVLWVALAEKAYAQANGAQFVTTMHVGSDSYSALDNGNPVWALQAITGKSASQFIVNPTNIASAWRSGQLIVLGTGSSPSSPYIVGGHAYAVVGYNPSSSMPFDVYNPWGTNSSGWALGTYHGHSVYGLFYAGGGFLSQNFVAQSIGYGAVVMNEHGHSPAQDTGIVNPGLVVSLSPRPSANVQRATIVGTPLSELVRMRRFSTRAATVLRCSIAFHAVPS
jgi:hypothetical protein